MGEIIKKLPTITDLMEGNEVTENELTFLLNQPPPAKFVQEHPTIKIKNKEGQFVPLKFIPRENIEYMITRIYGHWWLEIKSIQLIANSPVVIVRLYVKNPLTKEIEWQDGIGGSPIQTDAGKGAVDFMAMKSAGVMMAAPAAETYAFKDAAEKFGKIFGKDLNVREQLDYSNVLKQSPEEKQQQEEEKRLKIHLTNMRAKGYDDIDVILIEIPTEQHKKARELWNTL